MGQPKAYLIAYDIRDPKRLVRVHHYLRERALAVQYSVFVGRFSRDNLQEVVEGLRQRIEESEDDVRIYPVPERPRIFVLDRARDLAGVYLADEQLAGFLGQVFRAAGECSLQEGPAGEENFPDDDAFL